MVISQLLLKQGVSSTHFFFFFFFFFWREASVRSKRREKKDIPVDLFTVLAGEGEKVELGASCV